MNCLDEPVFMAVPNPMLTEFGIRYRLESCETTLFVDSEETSFCRTLFSFPTIIVVVEELSKRHRVVRQQIVVYMVCVVVIV